MLNFRKIVAVSCLSLIPIFSYAAPATSRIDLTGGTIAPKQDLTISLASLLESVQYEVNCVLTSTNDDKNVKFVDIEIFTSGGTKVYLDNAEVKNRYGQTSIAVGEDNNLRMTNVESGTGDFTVRNLDDTDTVKISNCYAEPQF